MIDYLARRTAYLIVVLIAVTFAVTMMMSLPSGDPAQVLAGPDASPEQIEAVRQALNLDDPALTRYATWLGDVVTGDLGDSLRTGEPVGGAIWSRLPVTLELVVLAQVVALLYAIPAAVYGAYRPAKATDRGTTMLSFLMISTPSYVLALLLIRVFAVQLGWLPTGGWVRLTEDPIGNLKAVVLPVLSLAVLPAGIYQRLLRSDMRRTLDEDFIMVAEAKGLRSRYILVRHSLRPSFFTLITMLGITSAQMIGGSVVVESIFGLPGIGRLMIDAISYRDFVMVQGVVAVIAVGYVVVNTAVDLLYGFVDPRVRIHGS